MRLSFLIVIILLAMNLKAQVRIGPKIGATFSQQNLDSDYEVWKRGFEFGILANMAIYESFYLQAEFLITEKGYKEEFGDKKIFNQLTATYWQLPVTIQYRRGVDVEYYGSAGVYLARWQSGKLRSRIDPNAEIVEEDYSFTKDYNVEGFKDNRQDMGILVGAGIIYPLSINHLMLDVRYNYGLVDVNDLMDEPDGYKKQTNSGLVVSLTLLFFL